ncbi:MAG: YkgJ family cysteine cluster protein [Thermodesulfobacteriota bacterium]
MNTQRTRCVRCGECCLKSSPTLQVEDLPLIENGWLPKKSLLTIRKGEMVRDNIRGTLTLTDREMIKVRERKGAGRGCLFYDDQGKACRIYSHRPLQCAVLKCWDTKEFMRVFEGPKLARASLIHDETLRGLLDVHEKRCSYRLLESCVRDIPKRGEEAVKRVMELLRFDFHLRNLVCTKLGIDEGEMDFLFGRPMVDTIVMFGLKVVQEPDGSFLLTTV